MTSDAKILEAFAARIKVPASDLCYIEAVHSWTNEGGVFNTIIGSGEGPRRVYMCVARHRLYFVRPSLANVVRGFGELAYEHIERIVQDNDSSTHVALELTWSRPRQLPASVLISSESRASLVERISICCVADWMLRSGKVVVSPVVEEDLKQRHKWGVVLPFDGYKLQVLHDFCFFVRRAFEPDSQATRGSYRVARGDSEVPPGVTLSVHRYDLVPIAELGRIGREHIRWVAMEYKQAMVRGKAHVVKDGLYQKRMNLSNDVSAWICWELLIRDGTHATAVMLLRRQYVPPLVESVQDFAIVLKCPMRAAASVLQGRGEGEKEEEVLRVLIHEARLMADTFGPRTQSVGINQDIVQARLDALLYDEEAYGWIRSRLRLRPSGGKCLEKFATVFAKGVVRTLRVENALRNPELWHEASQRVEALCDSTSERDLKPMSIATGVLQHPVELTSAEETPDVVHRWQARLARYLAYCLDGGLFGARLTLADLITNMASGTVSREAEDELAEIITFLLHLRDEDFRKPWEKSNLKLQLDGSGLLGPRRTAAVGASMVEVEGPSTSDALHCTFNDRVMQVLLELGYLQKILGSTPGSTSVEYASLLSLLMQCSASSVNLKATICRQIVASTAAGHGTTICPGLLHLMRTGGLFLATYATAALVNLTHAQELVKNFLMSAGAGAICIQQLRSNDDDLTQYTLMLLVSLTKFGNHRGILRQEGLLDELTGILMSWHEAVHVLASKRRILTEVCGVLGQMCNEDETRSAVLEQPGVLGTLLDMFDKLAGDQAEGVGTSTGVSKRRLNDDFVRMHSKLTFLLKQLCTGSLAKKEEVSHRVIRPMLAGLREESNLRHRDWVANTVVLLMLLAISKPVCRQLQHEGWGSVCASLQHSDVGKVANMSEWIDRINQYIQNARGEPIEVLESS